MKTRPESMVSQLKEYTQLGRSLSRLAELTSNLSDFAFEQDMSGSSGLYRRLQQSSRIAQSLADILEEFVLLSGEGVGSIVSSRVERILNYQILKL